MSVLLVVISIAPCGRMAGYRLSAYIGMIKSVGSERTNTNRKKLESTQMAKNGQGWVMGLILCEFHGSEKDLEYIRRDAEQSPDVVYVSKIRTDKKWIGDYFLAVRVNLQQI